MQILINHLTRMEKGFICVAGLELGARRHIRPVTPGARLASANLTCHGGVFEVGAIVDLGITSWVGQPPEFEDHRFVPRSAKQTGVCSTQQFWNELTAVAKTRLVDIFGPALTIRGYKSCGVDLGKGNASLGCLTPAAPIILSIVTGGGRPARMRAEISDGQFHLDLSVTDIRLFGSDHVTPDPVKLAWLEPLLQNPAEVVLSVGLTRAFSSQPGLPKAHWLQVNNLHPLQAPLWS